MKTRKPLTRRSVQRMVRRLLRGKYKDSCAPCSSVAGALREELNTIGVVECDHLIAVMNMSPNAAISDTREQPSTKEKNDQI